ncbi:hypothetical protein Efla_001288 [Eimeria flavescens]
MLSGRYSLSDYERLRDFMLISRRNEYHPHTYLQQMIAGQANRFTAEALAQHASRLIAKRRHLARKIRTSSRALSRLQEMPKDDFVQRPMTQRDLFLCLMPSYQAVSLTMVKTGEIVEDNL